MRLGQDSTDLSHPVGAEVEANHTVAVFDTNIVDDGRFDEFIAGIFGI
ncbi:MAG: hypothetical protein BWY75_02903 [bacterium ADurb.Bin425]|nr:MAG: hypothetical protein BWY75_02903 [bacterium ADurb.Bin425]